MEAELIAEPNKKKLPFKEEFNLAVALGITDGSRPDEAATRAQVAVMAMRACRIAEKLDKIINERR